MKKELAPIIEEIQGRNILVIGDMVADIYLDGRISRISREAPVLVLEQAGVIRDIAKRAYQALDCIGMARVDVFLTASGEVVINELNTILRAMR